MSLVEAFRSERRWMTAGILFAVAVIFLNLGSDGMYAAQEGRTAIITRNMLLSGNFLDMNADEGIPYEKPVGHYWLCLPFAKLFRLDAPEPIDVAAEWALRLPSALSAMLAIAVAAALAARIYGARCAAITMMVLSSMPISNNLARLAHIDMPLAAAFALAMYFLYTGYFEEWRCNRRIYGFYAVLGWGMVLKGPLVVILAGLTILGMMLWSRRWRMIRELRPLSGGLVFLLVALPWYVVETIRTDGAFFDEFIVNQNLRRFTGIGSTYREGKRMPLWYYGPKLPAVTLPWSLAAIAAAVFYGRRLIRLKFRMPTVFLLMWFATGFVFFSLSALKRSDYLLPIIPPLAVLTARAIETGCRSLPPLSRRWIWGVAAIALLLTVGLILNRSGVVTAFGERVVDGKISWVNDGDGRNIVLFSTFVNRFFPLAVLAAALLVASIGGGCRLAEHRNHFAVLGLIFAAVLAAILAYNCAIQPGTDRLKSVKPFVRQAHKLIPPGGKVGYSGGYNTELVFFLNRECHRRRIDFHHVMTSPKRAAALRKENPERWRELFRTPAGHHYPIVMLERLDLPTP